MSTSPAVHTEEGFAFEYGWWGIALAPCRPDVGTYGRYAHEFLPEGPPLEALSGDGFLARPPTVQDEVPERSRSVRAWRDRIINGLNALNLPLPTGFRDFYTDHRRADSIESCTDCFFLFEHDVTSVEVGGHALRFYVDSQYCVIWSIYWPPGGAEPFVIAGDPDCSIDGIYADRPELGLFPYVRCSDSFLEFVWRWDVENRIWYTTSWDREELTEPELVDYVARYDVEAERARWDGDDNVWG